MVTSSSAHRAASPAAPPRPRARVVIVDAHPLVRAGLRAVLSGLPELELVGEGATGADAIRLAHELDPDVLLFDVDASDDSLASLARLTGEGDRPRVIALTILAENETLVQVLRAGASGLISKDATEADITAALRSAATGEIYVRPRALAQLAASVRRHLPSPQARTARAHFDALSERERTVLEFVAGGLTGPEIGRHLRITAKTVDTYRHRIHEKIGLLHRADYIRFALEIGLLHKPKTENADGDGDGDRDST